MINNTQSKETGKTEMNLGDIYSFWNAEIEKFGCLQIIAKSEKGYVSTVILDAFFDAVPREKQLFTPVYLDQTHHNWDGEPMIDEVGPNPMPEHYHFICNQPPILQQDAGTHNGAWPENHLQMGLQYIWNQHPKALTQGYKAAKKSDDKVTIGTHEFRLSSIRHNIDEGERISLEDLAKFPALTELHLYGARENPVPYLKDLPLVSTLGWEGAECETLDLTETSIASLTIEPVGVNRIILGDAARSLTFTGDLSRLAEVEIIHPGKGKWLRLNIMTEQQAEIPNFNLPHVHAMRLKLGRIDFSTLYDAYPNVNSLQVWGQPGIAQNVEALGQFKELRTLWMMELFGFEAKDFPTPEQLPNLDSLWLSSVPREAGMHVKKTFKHIRSLDVDKLRNDKWLAENLHNPFRSWDGRSGTTKATAKKAASAFKKLNSAVEKAPDEAALLAAFSEFVEVFNTMDRKRQGIDTLEREEIYEVYMTLARKTDIGEEKLFELFEEARIF